MTVEGVDGRVVNKRRCERVFSDFLSFTLSVLFLLEAAAEVTH